MYNVQKGGIVRDDKIREEIARCGKTTGGELSGMIKYEVIVLVAKGRGGNCPGGKRTGRELSWWQKDVGNSPGGQRREGNCM